tara:strand:+ start:347 stop:463 length:117 start_codon:yes stop_codon:yes gene_type:complete
MAISMASSHPWSKAICSSLEIKDEDLNYFASISSENLE